MSASMKSAKAAAPYPDEGTSRKTQTFCRKERRLYLSRVYPDTPAPAPSETAGRDQLWDVRQDAKEARSAGRGAARAVRSLGQSPATRRFSTLGSVLVEREQHLVVQLEVDLDRVADPYVVELEYFRMRGPSRGGAGSTPAARILHGPLSRSESSRLLVVRELCDAGRGRTAKGGETGRCELPRGTEKTPASGIACALETGGEFTAETNDEGAS